MKKTKLPTSFTDNLAEIAEGLHGRPVNIDYAGEWNISASNATLLLDFMYKTGIIEITWLAEQQQMCFIKTAYQVN